MDQITKNYREAQLKVFVIDNTNLTNFINLKIIQSDVGATNWLTLTEEEFYAIKKILIGDTNA